MKKSVEILGLPIISITEGRELGMSKSLLIDAKNGVVAAITIEDEDWYRGVKLIPYESVIAIGEDAVTITHSENILNLDEAGDYERLLVENIRVIGTKAITKTGRIQGTITEVLIGDGGKIEKCEITTPSGELNEVTAAQISIFGKQVTVVDISEEKKNNFVTATPPFETFHEEEPAQELWTPSTEETVEALIEPLAAEETVEAAEVFDKPVEFAEESAEILETTTETSTAPEISEPPAEVQDTPTEQLIDTPTESVEPPASEQTVSEEVVTPEPIVEEPPAPVAEEKPVAEQPVAEPQPSEEDQKIAAMTQQAEDLRAAIKKAAANKAAKDTKPPKSAVDERRRRVLLGKHATKTITAESGTVVVEAGAEVTEEVLQRARLSNKFIELSMNVQ